MEKIDTARQRYSLLRYDARQAGIFIPKMKNSYLKD